MDSSFKTCSHNRSFSVDRESSYSVLSFADLANSSYLEGRNFRLFPNSLRSSFIILRYLVNRSVINYFAASNGDPKCLRSTPSFQVHFLQGCSLFQGLFLICAQVGVCFLAASFRWHCYGSVKQFRLSK